MATMEMPSPPTVEHTMDISPEIRMSKEDGITKSREPTNALTPPTSEEMNLDEAKKSHEHEDSELSDLDLDNEDDEEEIFPDHYWDGGKIPVFKPTMDQFRSFKKFVEKIDKYGMKSGIVKVIPPDEWRQSQPKLDDYVKRIRIKNPITQEFNGTQGVYTQQNVEKQRSYNLPEWKSLTEETQHQPPAKRGERRKNQAQVVRGGGNLRGRAAANAAPLESDESPAPKRKPGRPPGRPRRGPQPDNDDDSEGETAQRRGGRQNVASTPDTSANKPASKRPKGRPPGSKNGTGAGQTKSVTSRRLNNTADVADYIDEKAFKNFNYGLEDLDEYTPERCTELETHYWKSLGFNQPMYAADMPGSLFDDTVTSWNVAKLENLLDVLGTKVPGVNTAYLYMGMWKATFAWHLEDVDLYSINYIHFGAPKQWYSISQEDARKFEKAMKSVWPVDAKNCDQFLRHKTYLISPDVLQKQYGVKVNKLVHYEGEFVITFPYGYHSGYNIGYNCAESVNFATESWLDYGRIARKCNCETDNVWVDVFEIERKLRGEPTPEYIEETDDDSDLDGEDGNLPTPPASVKGKVTKKRKRGVKAEEPKKKKKLIRIRVRGPTREPCVLCPNENPWEPLIATDNGKKAHECCALFTPETYIENVDGKQLVRGASNIDRARLDLKCNFCRSKRGACFQCHARKCTRAFHASCALAAGVQIDAGMVPTFGEDGTEYYEMGYDFRCKFHRPKQPKNLAVETLESSKRIMSYGKEVKVNDVVQAQMIGGEVFAGLVIENRPGELAMIVDVLPEGNRVEVEYKYLLLLDPDDSQRQKPSSLAVPMPEGMSRKKLSLENRQDGVPTQDQPFHENPDFKWHDFYNLDMPPPGYLRALFQNPQTLTVDVDQPDQLYYYLGEVSTDAKCFFTDTPGGRAVVAKANFLDRVQPRPINQHQAPRQVLAAARPPPKQLASAALIRPAKPYVYKPKDPSQTNSYMWSVDQQALANQRNFLSESTPDRRLSQDYQMPLYDFQGNPMHPQSTPLRPFPHDHYYSMKTLPAAYPGEHSVFTKAARRESEGAQTMQRPDSSYAPNYQSVRQQQAQLKHSPVGGAPTVPMMGHQQTGSSVSPSLPPNPYAATESRGSPSAAAYGYHSPYGAPLTPATTQSHAPGLKDGPPTDEEYLTNLKKYPYLLQSYCRKPKVYESPYPVDGGWPQVHQRAPPPNGGANMAGVAARPWTPPYHALNGTESAAPQHMQPHDPSHSLPQPRYPQATYSTPQEFQRQIAALPSTASRDGAQARMMRDQAQVPYQQQHQQQQHWYPRNSFGQNYDTAQMWHSQSPKLAPTPSPLSDPNTPGQVNGAVARAREWASLPRAEVVPGPYPARGPSGSF